MLGMPAISTLDHVVSIYETFDDSHWTLPLMKVFQLCRFPSLLYFFHASSSYRRSLQPVQRSPSHMEDVPMLPWEKGNFLHDKFGHVILTQLHPQVEFKYSYLSMAFRILWKSSVSHTLLWLILIPLPKLSSLSCCDAPLYPAGLSLSVSSIWTLPFLSQSPTADLDLHSADQTSGGKAHLKADRTLICGCY